MVEQANDDGGDPSQDVKRQNAADGKPPPAADSSHTTEELSGLSSDELDEVEE